MAQPPSAGQADLKGEFNVKRKPRTIEQRERARVAALAYWSAPERRSEESDLTRWRMADPAVRARISAGMRSSARSTAPQGAG